MLSVIKGATRKDARWQTANEGRTRRQRNRETCLQFRDKSWVFIGREYVSESRGMELDLDFGETDAQDFVQSRTEDTITGWI
jgi:hypothetical protein